MIYGDDPIKWNERDPDAKDPLGLGTYTYVPNIHATMQSGNLYAYCINNPVMFVDSTGLAVYLIHGTGANNNTWSKEFQEYLTTEVFEGEEVIPMQWSGHLYPEARYNAAVEIFVEILKRYFQNPNEPIRIVGHSHGGNVAIMVANYLGQVGIKTETLITIATPVLGYKINDYSYIGQHINVYNNNDMVQLVAGSSLRRTFDGADNIRVVNGNIFNAHFGMHSNKDVWKKNITPRINK